MSDLTSMGGGLGMVVLGLGAVGLLIMLGLGGLAASKRRVPLAAFVVAPLLICMVGAVGAWVSASGSLSAIGNTAPDQMAAAASQGAYDAIQTDWFSRWIAAFLFGLGAWVAGIGAFMAGPWTRFTPMASVGAALITLIGAGAISAYATQYSIESGPVLIALLLFSGFGVAFSALRRAEYEESHRVAGMRFASAMCMLLAISYGSRAVTQEVRMDAFGPGGLADQADSMANAIMMWGDIAAPAIAISWLAFGFAILVAFAGFYYELGDVVEKYTLLDVAVTLLLLGSLGLVRTVEDWSIESLEAIETSAPAAAMFDKMKTDLPPALLPLEENVVSARPGDGGFGDVLLWNDEASTWSRIYKWTGTNWEEDSTPLASANDLSNLRPLLVMEGGHSATSIPEVLKKVGGSALLLLRAEEVKTETVVPPQLAFLQTTFLPLVLEERRDLTKDAWTMAGDTDIRFGPAAWFGPEEIEVPTVYTTAALADVGSEGLQVVIDDRTAVKDLVRTCLPAMFDQVEGESEVVRNETWCKFSAGHRHEVIQQAMDATEPKAPERFTARIGRPSALASNAIGADLIMKRIPYEYSALDWCFGEAIDEGEQLAGTMQVQLEISRKGRMSARLDERSENTNAMAFRCIRERIKGLEFKVDEAAWPAPSVEEGAPPQPPQILDLVLDIRG